MSRRMSLSCDWPDCPAFIEWDPDATRTPVLAREGWAYLIPFGDVCETHKKAPSHA